MDIIRVERDGAEFINVIQTGIGAISESGLGRLCGVSHKSIESWMDKVSVGTSDLPECLEHLRGQAIELELRGEKNSHLLLASFCAAMIEYYAFVSRKKNPTALFSYRKFAKMGIESWIQSITGWKPPQPEVQLPDLHFARDLIQTLTSQELPGNAYRLCLHLHRIGQTGERPTVAKICKDLGIHRATYHNNIHKLKNINALPSWFEIEVRKYPERIVRDWLHSELGGTIESPTPYGPMVSDRPEVIDLLTDDSVIEVKVIDNWKEAIGHVLVKGLHHPKHDPCIMLFSDTLRDLTTIRSCCEEFHIHMGFQLLEYRYDESDELLEIQRKKVLC